MPRRIDIELTSALSDGSYTWRAAGAREPKGVLPGSILPPGTAVGDELKVEIEQMVDGIEVLGVIKGREKAAPDLLELLPSDKPFEAVIESGPFQLKKNQVGCNLCVAFTDFLQQGAPVGIECIC